MIKLVLYYDAVMVGYTFIEEGAAIPGELLDKRTVVFKHLNLDHVLRCDSSFCQGGKRPLSVQATRWAITVEKVEPLVHVGTVDAGA